MHEFLKEGFIGSDSLTSWSFELGRKETSVGVASILDNILRKRLKFCYPYNVEIDQADFSIFMKPNDPPLGKVLGKNKAVMDAIKEFTENNPQSYGASIAIDWSVNLYLKTNETYKKRLVKPGEFQIHKGTRYPVILTISDSEWVHFYNNAQIWFPCVYKHNNNLGHAKRNIPLLNKAFKMLDRELEPKDIDFEPNEFNGAKVFKHGLKIQKGDCWCKRTSSWEKPLIWKTL
ncbi:MAG: hypothetical protein HYW05_01155 [Candidatus Diapherotrites archaeon]|nr:hypothetical protein [Candidatus Diapherotrites archaeon]